MEKKIFLCSFCGTTIQSTRSNLDRHEKLHRSIITKIQCPAKKCEATFQNKSNYWAHWLNSHSGMKMPNILIYTDEVNKRSNSSIRRSRVADVMASKNGKGGSLGVAQSDSHKGYDDGIDVGGRQESNDHLNLNIEKTECLDIESIIESCLLRDPFYGCLVV